MSGDMEVDIENIVCENKVDLEYAGQILTKMSENEDFRDVKLVAEIDKQKYSSFFTA